FRSVCLVPGWHSDLRQLSRCATCQTRRYDNRKDLQPVRSIGKCRAASEAGPEDKSLLSGWGLRTRERSVRALQSKKQQNLLRIHRSGQATAGRAAIQRDTVRRISKSDERRAVPLWHYDPGNGRKDRTHREAVRSASRRRRDQCADEDREGRKENNLFRPGAR